MVILLEQQAKNRNQQLVEWNSLTLRIMRRIVMSVLLLISTAAFAQHEVDDRYAPVKVPVSIVRVSVFRTDDRSVAVRQDSAQLPERIVEFDSLGRLVLDMYSISEPGFLANRKFYAQNGLSSSQYFIEDSLTDSGELESTEIYGGSGKLIFATRYIGSANYPVYYFYRAEGSLSHTTGYHIYPGHKERDHDTLWRKEEQYNAKGLIEKSRNYFYVNDHKSYLNQTRTYDYDSLDLLTKIVVQNEDDRVILTTVYRYNKAGQVIYSESISTSGWREIDSGLWEVDEYEYDLRGNVSSHIRKANTEDEIELTTWNTEYNSAGLPIKSTVTYQNNRKSYVWWKYDYR